VWLLPVAFSRDHGLFFREAAGPSGGCGALVRPILQHDRGASHVAGLEKGLRFSVRSRRGWRLCLENDPLRRLLVASGADLATAIVRQIPKRIRCRLQMKLKARRRGMFECLNEATFALGGGCRPGEGRVWPPDASGSGTTRSPLTTTTGRTHPRVAEPQSPGAGFPVNSRSTFRSRALASPADGPPCEDIRSGPSGD